MPGPTRHERGLETLTAERLRGLLSYDPDEGVFRWAVNRGKVHPGDVAGYVETDGYVRFMVDHRLHQAHRLAWLYVYGEWPRRLLDHIDGNHANNRISNLREANDVQNQQNRKPSGFGDSPLLGAQRDRERGGWISRIKVDGRSVHLGRFKTAEEANAAYLAAREAHHPYRTDRK